jgi:two-component system sensor histidine kinase TctE
MTPNSLSLRLRLFLVILTPLLLVSVALGVWRFEVAQDTSEELFDRSLLAAALAISRDVAISEGDALSPRTRSLISDAGGGEVFYHITGPAGIYVTGYAYPPAPPSEQTTDQPQYFVSSYREEDVRVLQMVEAATIGNLSGNTIVTVWQRVSEREAFAASLAQKAAALIAALMVTLALVVWFGVQLGLRPLRDLQNAIEIRSPEDLSHIRRSVPAEVSGIVATLNRLLKQVRQSIEAHQAFISDAAHQLRNPASAILSLAETLPDVRDVNPRHKQEMALKKEAKHLARLTEQLLSLERLRYDSASDQSIVELNQIAEQICADLGSKILSRDLDFEFTPATKPLLCIGDPILIGEALTNLIENAMQHGGENLSKITIRLSQSDGNGKLSVEDDGVGIPQDQIEAAFRRFGQLGTSSGSGLGLAFTDEVMKRHKGRISVSSLEMGTAIELAFPLAS